MHSLNKQLLNTNFVPGTVLVTGDKATNKRDQNSSPDGMYIPAENISQLNSAYNYLLLLLNQWVSMPPRAYLAKFRNFFFKIYLIFLFLAVLGLHCCVGFL